MSDDKKAAEAQSSETIEDQSDAAWDYYYTTAHINDFCTRKAFDAGIEYQKSKERETLKRFSQFRYERLDRAFKEHNLDSICITDDLIIEEFLSKEDYNDRAS